MLIGSNYIRRQRELAGMSVEELAEKVGVKASVLESWEKDTRSPTMNQMEKVTGIFGHRITIGMKKGK